MTEKPSEAPRAALSSLRAVLLLHDVVGMTAARRPRSASAWR
jgi:hypothetical protein